jgi:predicted phosphodiesterase
MTSPQSESPSPRGAPLAHQAQRIGLIGDVHTEYSRLRTAIEYLKGQQLDLLLCTGDLPDGASSPADVDRCCALLRDEGVLTVSGNHDRWIQDGEMRHLPGATPHDELSVATLQYLASLPSTIEIGTSKGTALLCHGLGGNDMAQVQAHERGKELLNNEALQALLKSGAYKFVLSGHTHKAGVLHIEGVAFINAGTLRRDRTPCCSVLDFEGDEIRLYDINEAGTVAERSRQRLVR